MVADVDDEQIAEVLANWTGIPAFKLTETLTTEAAADNNGPPHTFFPNFRPAHTHP